MSESSSPLIDLSPLKTSLNTVSVTSAFKVRNLELDKNERESKDCEFQKYLVPMRDFRLEEIHVTSLKKHIADCAVCSRRHEYLHKVFFTLSKNIPSLKMDPELQGDMERESNEFVDLFFRHQVKTSGQYENGRQLKPWQKVSGRLETWDHWPMVKDILKYVLISFLTVLFFKFVIK